VVLSVIRANVGLCTFAGIPIGYIALVKTVMVVICLPIVIYLVAKRKPRNCTAFILILALFVGSLMAYNARVYDDPMVTGYQVNAGSFWNPALSPYNELKPPFDWSVLFHIDLRGLLLAVHHGLFAFSPIPPIALAGFLCMRRIWLKALLLLSAFLLAVLLNMSWWCWYGGTSFGARLIHPFGVFLAIPFAILLDSHGNNPAFKAVIAFLLAVSSVFDATGALTQNMWN
jgi:hypothetical protein